MREKQQNTTSVIEIENLELIENKIDLKKSNFMLVFYADWCVHCKDLLETLDNVSSFEFTKPFDFLKVNCNLHKEDICAHFNINSYPTVRVYLKGKQTLITPNGRDLETLLEYVDKINSPNIINIESNKKIKKYSEEYGDVSFLLVERDQDKETYKCFQRLSESVEYKPLFYFFYIPQNKFKNQFDIKLPAVINLGINSQFNIHLSLENESIMTCDKIQQFIEENRYPIIKRLDLNYMSRLQRDKRIVLIVAINKKDISHINFLNNFFNNVAINKRQYVFSYLDANEDSHLLQFFNLKPDEIPKIIIYDFSQGKHFIDKYSYLNDINVMDKLNILLDKLDSDQIAWTTGYLVEDFLNKFGINISRTNLMIFFFGILTTFLILIIFCSCNIIDKYEMNKNKQE